MCKDLKRVYLSVRTVYIQLGNSCVSIQNSTYVIMIYITFLVFRICVKGWYWPTEEYPEAQYDST